ncbi:MAG: hypothetical protein CMH54_08695 [Myxococcales bacterium]|nr:hypothetical protein [Myxococcales bacterium]|tara:strand:+ start:113 stop:928 length:816 start_codon:yes stop_codon:yes gene_type:complete
MTHFMLDGFQGHRARFDDLRLIHELCSEIPEKLGLDPVMPPFLIPYYDGVEPEDAGISAFAFLMGGHITVHTFSYRECYFVDLLTPQTMDSERCTQDLLRSLPCEVSNIACFSRNGGAADELATEIDVHSDFGPHYLLDLDGYRGPREQGAIFGLLDSLPQRIGMTPIMRPYVVSTRSEDGEHVVSGMTMIAESHMALHVWPERGIARFDLFSCEFFDAETVLPTIRALLPAERFGETLAVRGSKYTSYQNSREQDVARTRRWVSRLTHSE